MAEQGHGNHWECLGNLDDALKKILPKVVQQGDTVEKAEVMTDCFENEKPEKHTVFSISINAELSAIALIVNNQKKQTNDIVSAYPFVQNKNQIRLKIMEIREWDNLIEGIIVGETEDEHTLSFFDTKYFKNKELYQIGRTYPFSFSALGYNVEYLKDKNFSFAGQQAVDWLAKIGRKPTYDSNGKVEPVVFDLSNLVSFLPQNEYPDDAEFQSPVFAVEIVSAFDTQFYKLKIQIYRDPDVFIDLYAKTTFFDRKPDTNDSVRGIIWLQGYLVENTEEQYSNLLNADGEPIIN
ncbi:MAG: hypothetical protein LBR10_06820 [Prevotellaceae bacterium]|jgi:hypothetical protein|nr:hypothetical protein [Prevotellaceae bacterium]